MLVLHSNRRFGGGGGGRGWVAEHKQGPGGEGARGGGVCCLGSPEIVQGIMKNSGGTSKQTAGHFLVVMSDSKEALLRDKAGGMHALSHTFILPTKPWTGRTTLPFCMVQPRRSRGVGGKKTSLFAKGGTDTRSLSLSFHWYQHPSQAARFQYSSNSFEWRCPHSEHTDVFDFPHERAPLSM